MYKLLFVLFIIKLYARINVFNIYNINNNVTTARVYTKLAI